MDTCVPSPNLLSTPFAQSPHMYCENSNVNYNSDLCSAVPDESGLLDDKFEDSTLTIFTPELINSITSTAPATGFTSTDLWNTKVAMDESLSHDTVMDAPFVPLGMDSEIFINLLNDSNDSRFSIPDFDFMSSYPPSSCHTPTPSSEPKIEFVEHPVSDRIAFPLGHKETASMMNANTFALKKYTTMKSNFPPRKSEPPVVVVAPVKVEEDQNLLMNPQPVKMEIKEEDQNLLMNPQPVKMEIKDVQFPKMVKKDVQFTKVNSCGVDVSELSPQTVPSFTASKQEVGSRQVKFEPNRPEMLMAQPCGKRSSTDVKDFMPEDFMTSAKNKRRRCDSGSSGITSEDGDDEDNDYQYQIDYDSDDDDLDADLAHMKPGGCESLIGGGKKQKQYFWQYNVQAKGPKGTRLKLAVESPSDPHILHGFEDPVFDEGNTTVAGIRHGGKARKGDGNEVTPNPHKLFKIGHQLLRLNKKINACQLGSDVPLAQRNESRKEKNKLASRACRLKKKAQHEANKIKLNGLEMEHGQINNVLRLLWPELRERAKCLQNEQKRLEVKPDPDNNLYTKLTGYISSNLKSMVADNTTDYVNDVIMTVEKGDLTGGLNIRAKKT